jgi:hypothetical protein
VCSEQPIPTGKIQGYRKFDKVRYQGHEYFINGRMSTGYAILMHLDGQKVELKPIPKFNKMKRVSARAAWMMSQKTTQSFSSQVRKQSGTTSKVGAEARHSSTKLKTS